MDSAQLTTQQVNQLHNVMMESFDVFGLELLMKLHVGRAPHSVFNPYVPPAKMMMDVVQAAQMQHWVPDLISGMRRANPGSAKIAAFASSVGLSAMPSGLETKISKAYPFIDIELMRKRLAEVEAQVCQIEISGGGEMRYGTGFLVGPNRVMTNFHVVEPVHAKKRTPGDVVLRFDYKKLNGKPTYFGTTFALAEETWLLDHSRRAPGDGQAQSSAVPEPTQLDYAILQLAVDAGNTAAFTEELVDSDKNDKLLPRGWVTPPPEGAVVLAPNDPVFIVQHPATQPIKLAHHPNSVIAVNANGTRVRYLTDTDTGSSGAPCFDKNFNLAALHQGGDPDQTTPEWNQGIPIDAIVKHLSGRGLAHLVSGEAIGATIDVSTSLNG